MAPAHHDRPRTTPTEHGPERACPRLPTVIELIVAFVLGAALAAGFALGWDALLVLAAGLVGLGLGVGVPAGLVYHLVLYRALVRRARPPPRWWWNPLAHHEGLPPDDLAAIRPWFHAGAAGFVATMLGCVLVVVALAKSAFAPE